MDDYDEEELKQNLLEKRYSIPIAVLLFIQIVTFTITFIVCSIITKTFEGAWFSMILIYDAICVWYILFVYNYYKKKKKKEANKKQTCNNKKDE